VSGSGTAAAGEREDQERDDLGGGVGEDIDDELADVVVDDPAGLDGGDDRGEVVVGEHHRRCLPGDVGAGLAHRDADVGAPQRWGVVDAIAGHRDDVTFGLQLFGDVQLGLGRRAREDDLLASRQDLGDPLLVPVVELFGVHDPPVLAADPHLLGDGRSRQWMIAGDHVHPDPGAVAPGDRVGGFGARRVEHRHQPEEAKLTLGLFAGRGSPGGRDGPAGEGQHPQAFLGVSLDLLGDLLASGLLQGQLGAVAGQDAHAQRQHRLGGTLGM
jgi:hypothetical protein